MGVQVHEPRGDVQTFAVQHPVGVGGVQAADLGDHPVLDADVAQEAGIAAAVEDGPAPDQDVELAHGFLRGDREYALESVLPGDFTM